MAKMDSSISWFYKRPTDSFPVTYAFTNDLVTGDTVASCTATIYDEDETDKTASMLSSKSVTATNVTFTVSSGISDTTYDVKLVAITSNSRVYTQHLTCEIFGDITLNSNLGDFDANSYVTVQQANDYIRNKYGHTSVWDTLSVDGKKRVLVEAARTINKYNYLEEKYYESQPMEFPRDDHEVITGNCATPLTVSSFKNTSLYSDTYNTYPTNYWKYGSCHITTATLVGEVKLINSSNKSTGVVAMKTDFSSIPTANTEFIIFAPIYDNIKHAQCEQAVYILNNQNSNTMFDYKELGAQRVRIGDTDMSFFKGSEKIGLSSISKKLLSRYFRKDIRIARA